MNTKTIGDRIKEIRNRLNLTQEKLANLLGIDHAYISKIEKGKGNPSELLLRHTCCALHISRKWLENGEGEMFIPPEQIVEETIKKNAPHISREVLTGIIRKTIQEYNLEDFDVHPDAVGVKTGDPELDRMIAFLIKLWSLEDEKLKAWASVQFDRAFPADIVEEVEKKSSEKQSQAEAG